MTIQRSTLEFLLVAIVLGSIMATTLHLGYGAGVLLMVFWAIVIYLFLRRKKRQATSNTSSESGATISTGNPHRDRDHAGGDSEAGGDGGGGD